MRGLFVFLKNRIAYSLYLLGFVILYLLFSFLELRKSQYINEYSVERIMNADQYKYLLGISEITSNIEYMIASLFFIYLIVAVLHKNTGIVTFLKVHYILILLLFLLGYILSISFAAPVGNITQALVLPFSVTSLVLFLYSALALKDRLHIRHHRGI